MITKIIKADGTEVVPGKNQWIEECGKCVELWQRDKKDSDLYHRVKRWYRRHILWIFYDGEMNAEKKLLQDLIVRSMTLEMARQANLLTRTNIECFCSKIVVWIRENYNNDYVKAWDAFGEGRRPL